MARPEKVRLGEILVQQKVLTEDQLRLALEEQKRSGRKLGRVFIEKGFVTEEAIAEALGSSVLGSDWRAKCSSLPNNCALANNTASRTVLLWVMFQSPPSAGVPHTSIGKVRRFD